MGCFSWKTADTKRSIPIHQSQRPTPVYLLQPCGVAPIEEKFYDGHGNFGGINAMVWLAENNASANGLDVSDMTEDSKFSLGVSLDCGSVFRDRVTGELWSIFRDHSPLVGGRFFAGTFDRPIRELNGKCANDLIESGQLVSVPLKSLLKFDRPLKFSFNPKAVYEGLPASEVCPHQGFPPAEDDPSYGM